MQYVGGKWIDWKTIFGDLKSYIEDPYERKYHTQVSTASQAVACFLWGIGVEAGTKYKSSGSSTDMSQARHVMRYLSFQDVISYNYTGARAYEMIVGRGLPVYIRGLDGTTGHAWVLDGALKQERLVETVTVQQVVIDSRKESRILYHCNFGWKGKCDGYYYETGVYTPAQPPIETDYGDRPGDKNRDYDNNSRVMYYNLW